MTINDIRAAYDAEAIAEYLRKDCDPAIHIKPDPVHRPAHYRRNGLELIDVLEAWGLDQDGYLMQAAQYIFRAKHKGSEIEDLRKARWYIERRITRLEDAQKKSKG